MIRVVVLDAGPLGLLCHTRSTAPVVACRRQGVRLRRDWFFGKLTGSLRDSLADRIGSELVVG